MEVGYRVVEITDGKVKSLFHSTNGSRVIPLDVWVQANTSVVRDGSRGKHYQAGWHFLKSQEEAISFFERMFRIKANRRIIKCYVRGNIRPKAHSSKGRCWLADEILIKSSDVGKEQS